MNQLQDHPAAAIFPLLDATDLEQLADSIAKNGQRKPIVLLDGQIVDGRNRYRACIQAGVKPVTEVYDPKVHGTNVLHFILDHNLYRRHLTVSQRAMIAAETLKMLQQQAEQRRQERTNQAPAPQSEPEKGGETKTLGDGTLVEEDENELPIPTQEQAASLAGVSERTMSDAMALAKDNPELTEKVKAGTITVNAAKKQAATKGKGKGKGKTSPPEMDPEAQAKHLAQRREHIKRIREVCGENFAQAFIDQDVLKTIKETGAFLALDNETMGKVAPLVATGWAVAKAAAHVTAAITGNTTLDTLINRAIAGKGTFIFNHNGYEVAITKI